MRNLSGLFLVIQQGKVQFIHQTAGEFLLIKDSSNCQNNRRWKGRLNMEDAHSLMWNICLSCLKLCPNYDYVAGTSFFNYAYWNWQRHYGCLSMEVAKSFILEAKKCCIQCIPVIRTFDQHRLVPELARPFEANTPSDIRRQHLYIVVYYGFQGVFDYMLEHDNLSLEEINYALQVACCFLRARLIQVLIEKGASTNSKSYARRYNPLALCLRNPLQMFSTTALKEAITVLADCGLSLKQRNSDGETEFHMAAAAGDVISMRSLISLGVNAEDVNNEGNTPLDIVLKGIHPGMRAGSLLKLGASPNTEHPSGLSPSVLS